MQIEISAAGPDDVHILIDLWVRANMARRSGLLKVDPDELRQRVQERMRIERAWFVVARAAQQPVAMANGLPARDIDGDGATIAGLMHLSMVAVDPKYWGQGIGQAMVTFSITRARKSPYDAIQLWTHASNERAKRLYVGVGFKPTGLTKLDDRQEVIEQYYLKLSG